jgi:hypothetical protein
MAPIKIGAILLSAFYFGVILLEYTKELEFSLTSRQWTSFFVDLLSI